jgi:hypothetical protein
MSKNLPAPASPQGLPAGFFALVEDVKARIRAAQTRAALAVNAEMVRLYWDIGRLIDERQQREGWGAAVIPQLTFEESPRLPHIRCGRLVRYCPNARTLNGDSSWPWPASEACGAQAKRSPCGGAT